MKTLIVNLVGASASGKTSVAKVLEKMDFNIIHSYTTRPARFESEWGHTFINGWEYDTEYGIFTGKLLGRGYFKETIEVRQCEMIAYEKLYNGHHYFATDSQVKKNDVNIYIVTPDGAEQVKEYYQDHSSVQVITIYLQADEEVRAKRLAKRVADQTRRAEVSKDKHLNEVWARLLPDRKIFNIVKADYIINANKVLDNVVSDVVAIIFNEIKGGVKK